MSKLEMFYLPLFNVEEGIQRFKAFRMLNFLLRHTHRHWESLDDIPLTNIVRASLAFLKNSVITLFCRPELLVGTAATHLENLNAMGVIGSQGGGNYQVMVITAKSKVGMVTVLDSHDKAAIRTV